MSSSEENQDLQAYLKNALKKRVNKGADHEWKAMADAVTQKMLQEDDEDDLDAAENITDDIVYYTDSIPYADSPKVENKTIEIKLDDSSDVLNIEEGLADENEDKIVKKLTVYDYNETLVIENTAKDPQPKPKCTVHVITDEKPEGELTCAQCSYKTNKRFLLTRHIKTHSDTRNFKCSVCERGFKSNSCLLNHMNSHLGRKPHQCKSCEMRFNTAGELARHVRYKHTHEKPHKCAECDYSSVELSKMRRHMRCHTGERPYQCPHCTYASPDAFKLKRHFRTHTGEKPYECDICMARFTQSNSLKSHKLIHSVGDRPVFQCTLCPTTCGRKTDLQLHIQKLHTSDHPIKCKRCGKELPDRYTYKVHVKTHEGEKCYRCTICPYASISQRHLDMHMLVHTNAKPFTCEQCGMAFRQRQLLVRHTNVYHNKDYVPPTPREKNHICPHCRRAFLRKGNLMRHMEMHDDTRIKNDSRKIQLKTMPFNLSDSSYKDSSTDEKSGIYNGTAVKEDNSKFVETFEVIDDTNESETIQCRFVYKNIEPQMKKPQTALPNIVKVENKSETKTRSGNYFIVASGSAATKKEQNLPIKIEIGSKDASDADEANDDFVVIEVIEDDEIADDEAGSNGDTNSIIAGDIIEIPFQTAAGKQNHINAFIDVLPVEVPEEV